MKLHFSADLCSFFMWLLQFPFLCLRWIDRSDIFILLLCKASGIKRKWKKPFYDHKYLWRPLLKLHCFLSLSLFFWFLLVFSFSCSTTNSIRLFVILDLFCDKFLLKLYLRNHIPQFKSCTWISFWCNIVNRNSPPIVLSLLLFSSLFWIVALFSMAQLTHMVKST